MPLPRAVKRRATYDDLRKVPEHLVAELVNLSRPSISICRFCGHVEPSGAIGGPAGSRFIGRLLGFGRAVLK